MRTRAIRFVTFVLILAAAREARADWLYAITTDNHLQLRQISAPSAVLASVAVTGLLPGTSLVAIDVRPLDGQIYALGIAPGSPTDDVRLYRLQPTTGVATLISQAPLAISALGDEQGFDFNPQTDLIRVVGDNEVNFRISPTTGAVIDSDPATPGVQPDTPLTNAGQVVAIGHSNNFVGTAGSTAYGIDVGTGMLVRVGGVGGAPSPNLGVVTVVNPLGITVDAMAGLDIVTPGNRLYAALRRPNSDVQLARIEVDFSTNAVTTVPIGLLDAPGEATVRDIAVQSRPVTAYALFDNGHLVRFKTHQPGNLLTDVAITGLVGPGESLQGLVLRPETGTFYGLSNQQNLYAIDRLNGSVASGITVSFSSLTGAHRGIAIDRGQDMLRFVTETGAHRRFFFATGGDNSPPTALSSPNIVGLAYSHDPTDPTRRTLYAVNDATNTLVRIGGPDGVPSPDDGAVTTIGPLGAGVDIEPLVGFDIQAATNTAYLVSRVGGIDRLYMTDLVTGTSTLVGAIGSGALPYGPVKGLTLGLPGRVALTAASASVNENAGNATLQVLRVHGSDGPISVDYSVTPAGAEPGVDYQPVSGTVIFLDGETTKTIQVPIVNDTLRETTIEEFIVRLSSPTLGASVVGAGQIIMRIVDDEFVNAPPTITIQSPTTEPAYTAQSQFFDLAGTASDDSRIVSVTWEDSDGNTGTAQGTTDWVIPALRASQDPRTIAVRALDETGAVSMDTIAVTFSQYAFVFAEGATGPFFDLDILLTNTDGIPADATLTFLREDGTTVTHTQTLAPMSRTTIRVDGIAGMESTSASTVVTSTRPLIAERTMRWGGTTTYGAHTEKAVAGPAQKWYFAEGSQGFFSTYLLLANPNATGNTATVEYLREGVSPITRTYPLAPLSRVTVDAGADPELVNRSFGMVVTFAQPAVAERSMYFGGDPLWKGGHESAGVTFPAQTWFLAEGATGPFFETFVLLANPQPAPAQVAVRYLLQDAPAIEKTYTVGASSRLTINIEGEDAALANVAVGTQIVSSLPIVVERAQYWPYAPDQWYEAHNSSGVIATDQYWGLAEGRTGGPDGYETYILLANPGTTQADVTITFYRTSGAPFAKTFAVPPASRLNIATGANGPIGELVNEEFSAVIESTVPIAVERAMYSTVGGITWSAGTNATATRFRSAP